MAKPATPPPEPEPWTPDKPLEDAEAEEEAQAQARFRARRDHLAANFKPKAPEKKRKFMDLDE